MRPLRPAEAFLNKSLFFLICAASLSGQSLTVTTATLPNALQGGSYSQTLAATGASGSITWSITAGSLPTGLTLDAPSGRIGGVPSITSPTPVAFTVKATDGASNQATKALAITVNRSAQVSYITISGNQEGVGLTRIPADGSSASTLASGLFAGAIAQDAGGNFILASISQLQRVTTTGTVSTIANAPPGAVWSSVAVDGSGNFILADYLQQKIWRVTPDGAIITPVATYTIQPGASTFQTFVAVDVHGNYILAQNEFSASQAPLVEFFVITPAGTVTPLNVTGPGVPQLVEGLTFDAAGNYMVLDTDNSRIDRITPAGSASIFASGISGAGLARNPVTGEYVAGQNNSPLKLVSADGASVTNLGAATSGNVSGVIASTADFVSTVDSTNPLAYFRLEATSGVSEVNGYTYSYSGTGSSVAASTAPVSTSPNNAATLDGSTGDVTTSLTGGINTAGSIMAWVNLAAQGSNPSYIAGESSGGNDFDLQFNNGFLSFYTTNSGANLAYTPNPNTLIGQWHMVVATFDATTSTRAIYWDGLRVASDTVTSSTNKPGVFEIGNSSVFSPRFFNGKIDEVGVWNYALTPSQIYSIFASSAGNFATASFPTITSLSPASVPAGSSDQAVVINGTNLGNTANLWFTDPSSGSTTVVPASVISNQVSATIPAALLVNPAHAEIAAVTGSGVPSNELPFTVAAPPPTINQLSNTTAAEHSLYAAIATASGGSGSYTWTISDSDEAFRGTLHINAAGNITGIPYTTGNSDGFVSIQVTVTDAVSQVNATRTFGIRITQGTPPTSLPGTSAYVLNAGGQVAAVAGTTSSSLGDGGASSCDFCQDMTRDAAGNFIVATGRNLTVLTPGGESFRDPIPTNSDSGFFSSVAVDSAGNFIVADTGTNTLFKMNPDGSNRTTVGTWTFSAGQGIPITSSQNAYVRIDGSGRYILAADSEQNSGPAFQLFVIDPANPVTPFIPVTLTGNTKPTSTQGLTFDASGNYIEIDPTNNFIFTIAPPQSGSSAVTTLFSNPSFILQTPSGITRDPGTGDFLLADYATSSLYTLTPNGATLTLVAVDGALTTPTSVIVSDTVATGASDFILQNAETTTITSIGGVTPTSLTCELCGNSAVDFATDSQGNFIVATGPNLVKVTPTASTALNLANPPYNFSSVAVDSAGNYVATDVRAHQVLRISPDGSTIVSVPYAINFSDGIEDAFVRIDASGNYIVAQDNSGQNPVAIYRIAPGALSSTPGSAVNPITLSPANPLTTLIGGLTIDGNGNYVLVDTETGSIDTITPSGNFSVLFDDSNDAFTGPAGIFFDKFTGNFLVSDVGSRTLFSLSSTGAQVGVIAGSLSSLVGALSYPSSLTISTSVLPSATVGQAYSFQLSAIGGSGNYTWTFTTVPPGLTVSASGLISGTPTGSTPASVAVTVTDTTTTRTASQTFPITINGPSAPTILTSSLPGGTTGQAYSTTMVASGGSGGYTWSISGLPAGLSISGAGVISGTPTSSGTFPSVIVTVTDTLTSLFSNQTLSLTIARGTLAITTTALPDAIWNVSYGPFTVKPSGGSGNFSWSIANAPAGITIDPSKGTIGGTPTALGLSTNVIVTLNDTSAESSVNQTYVMIVSPITISYAGFPPNPNRDAGGIAGLFLNSSANQAGSTTDGPVLRLTPSTTSSAGSAFSNPASQLQNNTSDTFSTFFQFRITNPGETGPGNGFVYLLQSVSAQSIGAGSGKGYSGITPSVGIAFDTLATSPTINRVGVVQNGDPTMLGTAAVNGVSTPCASPAGVPNCFANGDLWSAWIDYDGTNLHVAVADNSTVRPDDLISYPINLFSIFGTNNGYTGFTAGTGNNAETHDIVNWQFNNTYAPIVPPHITTSSLPAATVSASYGPLTLTASGGFGSFTWAATGLPEGLTVSEGGVISGSSAGTGTFPNVIVTATDNTTQLAVSRTFSLTVNAAAPPPSPLTITTGSAPNGTVGISYSVSMAATGGAAPYSWSVSGLPWLSINGSSGFVSGVPTTAGTGLSFNVTVTDSKQASTTKTFVINVAGALTITTSSLPGGTQNQTYSAALTATGGSGTYSWTISGVPGLSVNSGTGAISGAPTTGGTQTLGVTVTDPASGATASQTYQVTVAYAPLQITGSGGLGGFIPGATVSVSFGANGGKPPYSWTYSGAPSGISLNSTGQLTGNAPLQPGSYSFTVTVKDSQTQPGSASTTVTLSVLGFTSGSALPGGTTATTYSVSLTATGGTPPYSFSSANVPAGLTLAGSGFISGTPATAGTFTFTVQLTDSAGLSVSNSFTIAVKSGVQPLQVTGAALPDGAITTPYSQTLQAEAGQPPYTWSVLGGTLPAGLTLTSAGTISGTPTGTGPSTFTARAIDSAGAASSAVFTISVAAASLQITSASLPNAIAGVNYLPQTIDATGGTPPYTFALTAGTLPSPLTFLNGQISSGIPTATGTFGFGVTVTDAANKTSTGTYTIIVEPLHPDLILSQGSASFTVATHSTAPIAGASVTIASSVTAQLAWTASASPAAPWLDFTASGTTPGAIAIAPNAAAPALAPGTYGTTVTVACTATSACAGSSHTIVISLVVNAPPPLLSLGTTLLSFSATGTNTQALSQFLNVQNSGGGAITVNSISAPDSWIVVTGAPSTLTAGQAVPVTITANTSGLAAGYYQSTLTVTSSAGTIGIPVTLLIAANPTMTLSPGGAQFLSVAGNAPGSSNGSFLVSVSGTATVNWTASIVDPTSWLTLNTTSGASTSTAPGSVSYSINSTAATLAAKPYFATIRISAPTSSVVTPVLDYQIVLNVAPAASGSLPDPEPSGLVFISAGTATLPAQTVQVFASSATPVSYTALASSTGNWLSVSPATGTTSSGSPGQSSVTVNSAVLAAGIYHGTVNYSLSSEVRSVNVTLIVQGAAAHAVSGLRTTPQAACSPSQIVPVTQTGLLSNFSVPTAWPTPILIHLLDDCGSAIPSGQIVATFSNGDPPLALAPTDSTSGNYSATWTPRQTATQLTIAARATAPNLPAVTIQIAGHVTRNAAPVLAPNGTFNAFVPVPGSPLAPGMIVQIYGTNLAAGVVPSAVIPLTTSLGSTSVIIGGVPAPLYYMSPGQINAQIPFELAPGANYQVIVNANGSPSTPVPVQMALNAPGIAAFASGAIIAQHQDGSLVTEDAPAVPGEYIVFYVAGLGPTGTVVPTGAPSPSSPLAIPTDPPTLTINGANIPIAFVGLTPTLVGLYQVNFQVPADTPSGDLQLLLLQSGGQSNATVIPVAHQ